MEFGGGIVPGRSHQRFTTIFDYSVDRIINEQVWLNCMHCHVQEQGVDERGEGSVKRLNKSSRDGSFVCVSLKISGH